ncbi:MAG: FAD-dependent oxidoreductase, partial [Deltaproteobacteria bacterium]|nr:FAD-dependent oxidoreductase [Deltaproteobacteria bacterium]
MTTENKTGVYVCEGCEIGQAVKVEGLLEVATKEHRVPVCKSHPMLCGEQGVSLLKNDIANEGVNRMIIAACSPRYHKEKFDFGPEVVTARVPLREYVAWTQPHGEEDTQMAAADYIRMYAASISKLKPPEPFKQDTNRTVLVIGGGISGMTSALETARAGYQVVLLEKESRLGGFGNRLHLRVPTSPPYTQPEKNNLEETVQRVQEHPGIKVMLSSRVTSISGQPGEFQVKVENSGQAEEFKAGSIVLATGGRPYDKTKLPHLGAGLDNVITSVEFEEMAANGGVRTKDGKTPASVAFIQCAGSRDPEHLPYCSTFCCTTSLKQAAYLRSQDTGTKAYIIYRDMITPGRYENFYREQQADPGIFLTKGDVSAVKADDGQGLHLEVDNTLLGEKIDIQADLVVLAVGVEPSTKDDPILNLQYRQGPALPDLKYGFPDSHFICFPYETRRTGIYAAGTVRQPMDMNFAESDAGGAALKSIQSLELTSQGKAVHPRVGDTTY